MDELTQAAVDLVEDRPELKSSLRTVLEIDDAETAWTFHDVPLDSGEFGEIVGHGLVEETENGYRVVDRQAVRAAIDGEPVSEQTPGRDPAVSLSIPPVDRRAATVLGVLLALTVVLRSVLYGSVFVNGDVVLLGNDPYLYRYLVERAVAAAAPPLDVFAAASHPETVATGEPLLVVTLWLLSGLFGGNVGAVLAWYPVGVGVVTVVLTYLLAVKSTGDRRVGLAAAAILATTPVHVSRTALGFADHHAFDYVWLLLAAVALVELTTVATERDRNAVTGAFALAVAVAAQVLAWEAGPLLLLPVGGYATVWCVAALRNGRSPLRELAPAVAATGAGAGLVVLVHAAVGWHSPFVVAIPAVLFAGVAGVTLLSEAFFRAGLSARPLLGAMGAFSGGLVVAALFLIPDLASELPRRIRVLVGTPNISEAVPLFGETLGYFMGPVYLFGVSLYVAIPYMVAALWDGYRRRSFGLVAPAVYGWYFLGMAAIQNRFSGELSPFVAVFVGVGVVHLAHVVELIDRDPEPDAAEQSRGSIGDQSRAATEPGKYPSIELPDRRTALRLALVFLMVGGLGLLLAPGQVQLIDTDREDYRTATWIAAYADDRGLEHPDNYVFSPWEDNRAYNYFVSGESEEYSFAKNNYDDFLASTNGSKWYQQFPGRTGFVVTAPQEDEYPDDSMYALLHERPSNDDVVAPLEHYRLIHVEDGGARMVYEFVPGATIQGSAEPNSTVTVSTTVSVGGRSLQYERTVEVSEDGLYWVTVPYAGTYRIGNETVDVSGQAVDEGEVLRR